MHPLEIWWQALPRELQAANCEKGVHRHFTGGRGSCETAQAHLLLMTELAHPVGELLAHEVGLQAGLAGAGGPTAGPTAGALLQ